MQLIAKITLPAPFNVVAKGYPAEKEFETLNRILPTLKRKQEL